MNTATVRQSSSPDLVVTRQSVLLVDDEPNILEALSRTLRKENFDIITATSGEQALSLLFNRSVDLVISDQRMPGMGGSELISKIKERYPETIRIILTGYQDISAAVAAINEGGAYQFLQKPWDDETLKLTIRRALLQYQLTQENKSLRTQVEKQNQELKDLNLRLEKRFEEKARLADKKSEEAKNLNDDLRKNFASSIEVIRKIISIRQPEENDHHLQVKKIVDFILPRMGIEPPDSVWISTAAALHGIGRSVLPDAILSRTVNAMSEAERKIYESHVLHAAEIMECIPQLKPLAPLLRSHQERWDGKGYPDRLKGDDIPTGAQIIGIASDYVRSRTRLTVDQARDLIFRNSGLAYQPKLVQLMVEYIQHEESALPTFTIAQLRPHQLKEGMVLANDLKTSTGLLIASKESSLSLMSIEKIKERHAALPFIEPIMVYSRFVENKERKGGA